MATSLHDDALELPGYSRGVGSRRSVDHFDHEYSLENSKGHKWLSMSVKSRSTDPRSLPIYYERDIVTGRVQLNLDKPENIKGVVVSVSSSTRLIMFNRTPK